LLAEYLRGLSSGKGDLVDDGICGIVVEAALRVEVCGAESREEGGIGAVGVAFEIVAVGSNGLYVDGCIPPNNLNRSSSRRRRKRWLNRSGSMKLRLSLKVHGCFREIELRWRGQSLLI
jgi:hypothetical protein